MQTVAEYQGDQHAYNDKRCRSQIDVEVEKSVPDKRMNEIDRIADLTQCREQPVRKAFETKGGLIESKADEDGGDGEDDPGYAGGNIDDSRVKQQ